MPAQSPTINPPRTRWLAVGAISGALLAATGLIDSDRTAMDPGWAATIDGTPVSRTRYSAAIEALESSRERLLTAAERDHVLDRLIDESLLIRQGERTGLTHSEPAVRKALVDAAIENILSQQAGEPPSEVQLTNFYAEQAAYFAPVPLLQVQRMVFRGAAADARSQAAHAALVAGETFAAVSARWADEDIMSLPASPLPRSRLPQYLGATQVDLLAELQPGQFSAPVASSNDWVILLLHSRTAAATPPLDQIRAQVEREYRRRNNDLALRQYLDQLRAQATIRKNEDSPESDQRP